MAGTHMNTGHADASTSAAQQVYASAWDRHCHSLRTTGREDNHAILRNTDERDHLVVTRIMGWLGTDEGIDFLATAETMTQNMRSKPDAYAAAWGAANYSKPGGWRLIERLMIDSQLAGEPVRPVLTPRDYEIADMLINWLGSGEGQNFLARCDAMLAGATSRAN